jgi:hypothetical protein
MVMYSLNIVTNYVLQNTRPLIIGKSDHDRPNKPASLAQSIDSLPFHFYFLSLIIRFHDTYFGNHHKKPVFINTK